MKRYSFCIAALPLLLGLAGCAVVSGAPAIVPADTPAPMQWQVTQPTPAIAPTLDPSFLTRPDEKGYTEVDIDLSDEYRDFVLEEWLTDQYGSSTFFRLREGKYVQLGTLDGYVTDQLGRPHIWLDGKGYVYENGYSVHLGWARVGRVYEVQDWQLVELPPFNHVYYPVEEYEFKVLQTAYIYSTGYSTQELKALSPAEHTPFDWASICEGHNERKPIGKGDRVVAFGTDERGHVLLDYKGNAYLLAMATAQQTDVYGDQLDNLCFFNEFFYNKQVDGYYYAS